ncbi:UDP-N-acetylmuramate--L-alanine ligase [Candidatus Jidaibacter acanthamoebae]|nr:UDP-N-acetylmuramate--L-alanine ligase [Candidatus Jidaibacter acanthamoeba]
MNSQLYSISPIEVGIIHFIGIGGIGMSGMAEILKNLGYQVQGSDISDSYVTERLEKLGIPVFIGHKEENVKDAAIIVRSTAINPFNPEIIAAKNLNIPIIKRSEMLAEIMRFKHCIAVSGTHGKTTTTSLVAKMLEEAALNPTVINGGIINELGTNARLGSGKFLVAEADESDGTFISIPAFVAVVTNIDPEHLDYYGSFENAKDAYFKFIENLPFYGFGVLCFDHETVREVAARVTNRLIISYGIKNKNADLVAVNINQALEEITFDVKISETLQKHLKIDFNEIKDIKLSISGEHNLLNSLAAVVVALKLNISKELIQKGLSTFQGVKRRFTKVAEINGISIIDDYAHHPIEIKATLKTARKIADDKSSKVIVIAQPHRYSRLKDLMDEFSICFKEADVLYISEVYPAGEEPINGVDSQALVQNIKKTTGQEVYLLPDHNQIASILKSTIQPNDLVIFLGAGNITKWAYQLPEQLANLQKIKVA